MRTITLCSPGHVKTCDAVFNFIWIGLYPHSSTKITSSRYGAHAIINAPVGWRGGVACTELCASNLKPGFGFQS